MTLAKGNTARSVPLGFALLAVHAEGGPRKHGRAFPDLESTGGLAGKARGDARWGERPLEGFERADGGLTPAERRAGGDGPRELPNDVESFAEIGVRARAELRELRWRRAMRNDDRR